MTTRRYQQPDLFAGPAGISALCEPASLALVSETDLLALFASVGRAVAERCLHKRPCLNSWNLVLDYLKSTMGFNEKEQFRCLFLDKRNNLIGDEIMWTGTVDHVPVYPREVAKRALELSATALILVHNHPSGDTTPSQADISMTKTLVETLSGLGITIHDHIIVGRDTHTSLKAKRLM